MTRTRVALALVPLLGLALATQGHAAPAKAPQIKDAKGDAVTAQGDNDIVSVIWTTTGKGSGKAYVPKQLVVTMTLAAPPSKVPLFTYEAEAATTTCGDVAFSMQDGSPYTSVTGLNGWADWGDCEEGVELLTTQVKGSAITWAFSLKAVPTKVGTVFSDFRARIDPTNPAVPLPSNTTGTELGLIDSATGTGSWKVA